MNEIPAAGETFRGDDGTVSTILPANYGQDYEASDGELEEYAEYIGIDAAKEPELMWIAQEGLRAPLPDGWRACQTDENEVYYFNFQSGESLWDHPMDEHYKAKVIAERAKHRSGGGGSSSKAGGAAARTGTTKALTDSLFLKPAASTSVPLTVATAAADDGASAPRAQPDVSDILSLAASSPLGPASARAGGAGAAAGPPKLKEAEAAVRKRLEEQTEAQLRALRVEFGKTEDAARQRLEEAKTRLQTELDTAWERERTSTAGGGAAGGAASTTAAATQRRLQTAREVKQLEESWKTRLNDVRTRVADLQHKVEEQQQALQRSIHQPPEELRKTLEARNAAEMAQLREAARRQNDVALQRLKADHAAEQAKAAAKAAETVAAAEKLSEGTQAQRAEERKAQNASMLAALQAALAAKQAELAAKEKAAVAAASSTSTSGTAAGGAGSGESPSPLLQQVRQLSAQDKAAIAAAQAAADAEVTAARRANAVALTRLTEEYEARRREKEAGLRLASTSRASSALQTPTRDLSKVSSNSSFSVNAVSPAEQAKLDEEEQKLRDEAEKAARIYEEETELMVSNKEAGRPLTAIPLPSAAANVSAEAVAALSRTATQAQRARDAENGRHSMAVKQLEAKHEQAVRLMKTQHEKAMAAASTAFNPRQHPSFTAQLNARKRSWTRDHPTPSMEMPTLTPIPSLPAATMSTSMAATTMPDAEEQAKIVKTRLTQTREELQRRFDRELQSLQRGKEEELAGWQTQYRTTRLAAVQEAVKKLQAAKDAEVEAAKAKAKEHAAAATAIATAAEAATASAHREAAEKAAVAAATEKLQALEAQLRTAEATATHNEAASKTATAALEKEVADLEAALLALTQEVSAAEKAREEYRAKTASVAAEASDLIKKGAEAATSSTAATPQSLDSAPSMAFFISDAAASAEEDALRTRWVTLLATLRTAVQREMDAYERAVAETARLRAAAAVSPEPVNSGNGALPPTVPVSASYTFMSTAAPNTASQPQAGATAASVGYATPLQRPPLSATADYRSYPAETSVGPCPEVRLFVNTPQQQQQQSWMHGGGGGPVEHGYATGGQRFYDTTPLAFQRGTSGHSTQRSLPSSLNFTHADEFSGLYPSTQRQQPGETSQYMQQRGTALAAGGGEEEKDDYALRLAALHEAVRERRHELQAQRRDLEQLRSEWKADMQRCRERDDKAEAQKLRVVKAVLEERAHRLNEAVLEVKAMQHDVQTDLRRYQQWVQQHEQQPQQQGEGRRFSARSASAAYALASEDRAWEQSVNGGPYGSAPRAGSAASVHSSASVVGLLEGIVARTERLESLLRRNRHTGGDRTPSPGRDYARH